MAPEENNSQSTPKQQVVERLKQATNVLVTVKTNPNVDELAATIGLTLMLNKLGKHATAVFSGEVPSTLEFLKPEETLETNTDSLRDFIVSLDKSKADKLRYKVEENVVKIFITPYRTSISQDDLEFTQGDFNVDAVVALGVTQREELDQAIVAHGRILHDATVITVTAGQDHSELGQINWQEAAASSLSEMLVSISEAFQGGLIDEQIATAFLTGIVAETERFSNTKTSPKVMTMAAQLMAAGANQQLIANELEKAVEVNLDEPVSEPADTPEESAPPAVAHDDGSLAITHDEPEAPVENKMEETEPAQAPEALAPSELPAAPLMTEPTPETKEEPAPPPPMPDFSEPEEGESNQIEIDHEGNLKRATVAPKHKVIQPLPPAEPESPAPSFAPVGQAGDAPTAPELSSEPPVSEPIGPDNAAVLPPPPPLDLTPSAPIPDNTTISQLEQAVHSTSPEPTPADQSVDMARNAVQDALNQTGFDPAGAARADLNAMPLEAPPAPTPFDTYRLPDAPPAPTAPVVDTSDSLLPTPNEPEVRTQVPGGMPLHTLGEVLPENNQDKTLPPPPPVPPPMTAR